MRNQFDRELETLNKDLVEMGLLIETAIVNAVKAFMEKDDDLARKAVVFDQEVNGKEKDIEQRCLKLLLQQQPVATDLRIISTALKMITDMERIGDQAADISEITLRMQNRDYIEMVTHIPQMAEATIKMVKDSVDAFVNRDLRQAVEVSKYDDVVDDLFNKVKHDLIHLIHQDVENGEIAVDLLMVAKYFERIGDHAVNIAEWVMFSITGTHNQERVV